MANHDGARAGRDGDPSTCDPPIRLQVWHNAPADNYMVVIDGGTVTVTTADVNGSLRAHNAGGVSGSTQDDIAEMEAIVASVGIQP